MTNAEALREARYIVDYADAHGGQLPPDKWGKTLAIARALVEASERIQQMNEARLAMGRAIRGPQP